MNGKLPNNKEAACTRSALTASEAPATEQAPPPRRFVRYGECKCILTQYCDGTCNPIFEDAALRSSLSDSAVSTNPGPLSSNPSLDSAVSSEQTSPLDGLTPELLFGAACCVMYGVTHEPTAEKLHAIAKALKTQRFAALSTPPAVLPGHVIVPVERIQNAAAHAKLAADCIVGMAKEKPGNMCGWLDDACTSADIAHDVLRKLLSAAPAAPQPQKEQPK